jgi:hypothetical protein
VQLDVTKNGISWGYRDVQDELQLLAIMDVRSLDLEQIGEMMEEELLLMGLGLKSGCV